MNIVYHSSNSFSKVLATSIVSVFENNSDLKDITVFIIERSFSEETKRTFLDISLKYQRNIFFIKMPDINLLEGLNLKSIKEKWVFDSYCRLFLDDLLPPTVDKVLYLDADVICTGSLNELWSLDMDGKTIAGVTDWIGDGYYTLFGLNKSSHYCNSDTYKSIAMETTRL